MTQCSECGYGYCEDLPENVIQHSAYHDKVVQGVHAPMSGTGDVVWEAGTKRITVVTPFSPRATQEVAAEVAWLTSLDTRFDGVPFSACEEPDKRNVQVFLYHDKNRIIGLLIFEQRETIWKAIWRQSPRPHIEKLSDASPIWSVRMLWVNRNHRRKGVARCILDEAMRHLHTNSADIGWQTKFTHDGESFVHALYPISFLIAK